MRTTKSGDMHGGHYRSMETLLDGTQRRGRSYEKLADGIVNIVRILARQPPIYDYQLYQRINPGIAKMLNSADKNKMDYFAITDHDEIRPVLELLATRPELESRIIVGEEVTARMKDRGFDVHVGVYGLNESQHAEIQKAKHNLEGELIPLLNSFDLLYSLNHPMIAYAIKKGNTITRENLEKLKSLFKVVEKRNGLLPKKFNLAAENFFKDNFSIAGSDSHDGSVGRTFTETEATDKEDFLMQIKKGNGRICGQHQTFSALVKEIYERVDGYGQVLYWREPSIYSPDAKRLAGMKKWDQTIIDDPLDPTKKLVRIPIPKQWKPVERFVAYFIKTIAPIWAAFYRFTDPGVQEIE